MSRGTFDARQGWQILGFSLAVPFAVTGLVSALVYVFATWGEEPASTPSSTLSWGLQVLIVLVIRYIALAAWWGWFSLATGRPATRGLPAALPIIGIYWTLLLVAPFIRGEARLRPVSSTWTRGAVAIVAVSLLVLPIAMTIATTMSQREDIRLAAPCEFGRDLSEGEALVTVSGRVLGAAALDREAQALSGTTWEAGASRSPLLRLDAANAATWELLLQEISAPRPTVGSVEARAGERIGDADYLRSLCLDETRAEFLGSRDQEDAATAVAKLAVDVNPALGFWDPKTGYITATKPAPQKADSAAQAQAQADVSFRTRVDYDSASLKDTETDGLEWTADLCLTSSSLLSPTYRNAIRLYKREGAGWAWQSGAKVQTKAGGRCGKGGVNVLVTSTAPDPGPAWVGKGWTTCRDYEVRIPETAQFAATDVPMCVSVDASAKGDS